MPVLLLLVVASLHVLVLVLYYSTSIHLRPPNAFSLNDDTKLTVPLCMLVRQRLRRAGDGLRWWRAAVTTIAAKRPLLRKQPPLLLVACYSCFCWRIAAPHALSKNPPRLREAVLRGCHSTCYFIWPTYQPNHVLHKYVVFAWLVFFLLMVGFQFCYAVLLHQFT